MDIVQPDTGINKSGSYEVVTAGDEPGTDKKKMKIIFENDTIKELSINGKPVKKEDMDQYKEDIAKIQKELQKTQQDLENANSELAQAQRELRSEGDEIDLMYRDRYSPGFYEYNREMLDNLRAQAEINRQKWEEIIHSEEYQKNMQRARENADKLQQYLKDHEQEFREQLQKNMEEFIKKFEELRKNQENYDMYYIVPPVPHISIPEIPDLPEISPEVAPDETEFFNQFNIQQGESKKDMNSTLQELEEAE